MCGIVGAVGAPGQHRDWVVASSAALAHRGPDDVGFFESPDERVVLGHRRLAIIDLSPGGHQPMEAPDGSGCVLLYNGEIYNHVELRAELEGLGHRFRSRSDSEVILVAHAQWGRGCVERFVGMWAFALLDPRIGTLWLSRDPFGIKPLYWAATAGGIAFASEPQVLVDVAGSTIDVQAAYDHLRWGHVDRSDRTFLAGVSRVPAGGSLSCDIATGAITAAPALALPERRARADGSVEWADAVAELRRLVVRSVELHLRSDVPVGSALSGGTDSSSIVMLMREVGGAGVDLHTFSFVAPGDAVDESRFSGLVSLAAAATAHPVTIGSDDVATMVDDVARAQFEPFGSLSILAQYAVFREARRAGVTVMLDGQGADELFGGYPSFLAERLSDLLRQGSMVRASRLAAALARHAGPGAVARAAARALPRTVAVQLWSRWMARSTPAWLDVAWFERAGAVIGPDPADLPASFDRAVELSQTTSSLPGLLRYEDRNSMAHSIESRVPFLTPELAQFASALPAEWLIGERGRRKSILVEAMRGVVPDAVLDRTDKVAFSVPESTWRRHLPQPVGHVDGLVPGSDQRDTRAWTYSRFLSRLDAAS